MFASHKLSLIVMLALPIAAWSRSGGAPPGHAGVPGEAVCTACHVGTANSGSGRVRIQLPGGATTYVPGQSIRLTIHVEDPSAQRWGFELTSRSAASPGTASGTLSTVAGDALAQVLGAPGSVQHVTHTSAGTRPGTAGSASWEVDWMPPAGGGAVTLFAAGNAANNNNTPVGDQIYTTSVTLQPAADPGPTGAMRVLAQHAFGGGWSSSMYFHNAGQAPVSFPVRIYNSAGELVGTPRTVDLPAGGSTIIESPNQGNLTQGWAGAELPADVIGHGVFRQSVTGRADQEAVVPFTARTDATRVLLLFDDITPLRTAVAVANPNASDINVMLVARDSNGQTIGQPLTLTLRARERQAFVLSDRAELNGVAGKRGSVEFTSSGGSVAVLGLRFADSAFTSIPAVER